MKGIGSLSASAGLDKLQKGLTDIFQGGMQFKGGVFDTKPAKLEGDKLSASQHEESMARARITEAQNKEILKTLKELNKNTNALSGHFTGMTKKLDTIDKNTKK